MIKKVELPKGFKYYGKHIGIKRRRKDLGIIYSDTVSHSSAVFTKNTLCGVSIPIGRKNIENGELQGVVVTSGVANVATGNEGRDNTLSILEALSKKLNIPSENILPSSTGIIGKQLPIEKVLEAIPTIQLEEGEKALRDFAQAILTTDKDVKLMSIKVGEATVLGIAKGSGMLEPNMATMLVYLLSDAKIDKESLKEMWLKSVNGSFNMMSIDTDTSTSDTAAILCNGVAGEVDYDEFSHALDYICLGLMKEILLDAEGATKLIEVNVTGAATFEQAKKIGKSIINSPLVKTAIYGCDPNWGRLIMALGKTFEQDLDMERIKIEFDSVIIFEKGTGVDGNHQKVRNYLKENKEVKIKIDLGISDQWATVYGCDLSENYIFLNGKYTS